MNQPTHKVVTSNGRPPTPIEEVKALLGSKEYMKQITNYFRDNKNEAMAFLTACVEYVRKTPKLLNCDHTSLLSAFMISAQFRFMPSGVSGECYIVPYGNDANFQLGYQGLVTLIWRTGKVKAIRANIVYANDEFEYEEGLQAKLIHRPAKFGVKRGEAVGVYTIAETINGGVMYAVMSKEQVMEIKELSKAKNTKDSPWNSGNDPEKWMWKKSCLIQLAKLLPKSQEIVKAIEVDYKGEGLEKPTFDAAGPAVGAALHKPLETNEEQTHDEQNNNTTS